MSPQQGMMAFLMIPLGHHLPNVIVQFHPNATMKVDPAAVESNKQDLLRMISQ
jgi:hypothetical protein